MLWNFFGSGRGKGEHDGVGAIAKRKLWKEQLRLNATPFQNAWNVVKLLIKSFAKEYVEPTSSHANVM
jgi:hypothetical protein